MAAISFQSVSKTYKTRQGEIPALQDLSFDVPEGSIYGFAGPNGAGKSTALKILVGLITADSGRVDVFGNPGGTKEAKRLIGFLPEVTLYHEFMGAEELLRVHASLAGIASKDRTQKCEEALQKVGLIERRRSRLKEFSKGMKQRFGIAQAIVGEPRLLVLDELTSGLDPKAQASLLELFQELRSQGLTIFFSSHHLREIEKVCDSVAIIHQGVLRASGRLRSLLGGQELVSVNLVFKEGFTPPSEPAWKKEPDGGYSTSVPPSEAIPLLVGLKDSAQSIQLVESRKQNLEDLFAHLTTDLEVTA